MGVNKDKPFNKYDRALTVIGLIMFTLLFVVFGVVNVLAGLFIFYAIGGMFEHIGNKMKAKRKSDTVRFKHSD